MERACLLSGSAPPSLFLTACETFAKAGSAFSSPAHFAESGFSFTLLLLINLEVSLHNLLESSMLGLLVSAFLSPTMQPCKAAKGYGGRRVGN